MKRITRVRIIQIASLLFFQILGMALLAWLLPGFSVTSLGSLVLVMIAFAVAQAAFWWIFVNFFAWLPVWLYPIVTFVVNGIVITAFGRLVPGVTIADWWTGLLIAIGITVIHAIVGTLLTVDEDAQFDRNVTMPIVKRRGKPQQTDVPGFLFLEIDGLSIDILQRAIKDGYMPTLKRWLDSGSHCITGWETDYSSQTGAMQTGILLGSNENIPAYRWWDRTQGKVTMVGNPKDALATEKRLSTGKGLLSDGGASRGNMFSGDATESMFTYSTLLKRPRETGPGFYTFLLSPYVLARLLTRFFGLVFKEWYQQSRQRRRGDKYICNARDFKYAFFRGFMGPILEDLTTYTVISDALRGVPAVYALYAGYDDLAHFAGNQTPEAFEELEDTDRYFARIERALTMAPRPYHIVILADHGQVGGPTFEAAFGLKIEDLVKGLLSGDPKVYADLDTDEAWDNLNAVLSDATTGNTRTAGFVRTMLKSKQRDGVVMAGPEGIRDGGGSNHVDGKVVVFASGCAGLVYFTDSKERMTYERIQEQHPDLILGLGQHPGIGFLLLHSEQFGPVVAAKGGIHYLSDGKVDGIDPLANYGPNARHHLLRESSFADCPDILINTLYDPVSDEMPGLENQASHHGGLGGKQNRPFVLHPTSLPVDEPLIGAESVWRAMRGWRVQSQGIPE